MGDVSCDDHPRQGSVNHTGNMPEGPLPCVNTRNAPSNLSVFSVHLK
ncbi:hypothetical protein AB395_00003350 [Sinorhizobium fredii CCBAU 45436]|nr:hypothetical protein SF83666_c32160 [Sinorhizobium fredii CCBAU 83666]AWI58986.1 hypothetical protein AB395_00003350 [Sinorhizobium fredii CCBAU 45436]AWM26694.1 hypothetical protein AOX55_00003462 [Sinorhizobium fredii CCBAU 25509]